MTMPIGMRPERSISLLVAITTNGLGMKASIMISSDRRRPRDASALRSASRSASCWNCASLSIADLQVGDCLCGGVEDALDGGAVHATGELGDAFCEPGDRRLQRSVGFECSVRAGFDLGEHVALVGEHAAAQWRHSVRALSAALLPGVDELLGAQSGESRIDAAG